MAFLLLLLMLTACAAVPQDLSGKMFSFPEETKTAYVKLIPSGDNFGAVTVCLRFFTDLDRPYSIFSLATKSAHNSFLIFKESGKDRVDVYVRNSNAIFLGQDCILNTWNSVCATWDSKDGLVQLWLNGKPTVRKFVSSGSNIAGPSTIIIGQEQDSPGGSFDIKQSFVGMISDVHMWDHVLSSCEIQRYKDDLNFTPGNVVNWRALTFNAKGRVLLENKKMACH